MMKGMAITLIPLVLWIGCTTDTEAVDPSIQPNESVRMMLEPPAPQVPKAKPSQDAKKRLVAAESLVGGFEVPAGLALLQARSDHLLFELQANTYQIEEFFSGVDQRTGLRFSARDYQVELGKNGFDVHHTASTLDRLYITQKSDHGHIYVQALNRKTHHFRIHPPVDKRRQAVATSEAFRPIKTHSKTAQHRNKSSVSERAENTTKGRATPFRMTSSGQPFRSTSNSKKSAKPHARQFAPYGKGRVQNLRQTIKDWQLNNPGKEFHD